MEALDGGLETRSALALAAVPELGPARIRWLVDRYGSARAVLERGERAGHPTLPARIRRRLSEARPAPDERLATLREKGIRLLTYGAPGYPERLTHLHHPPPVLYLRGPLAPGAGPAVAVVGTRRATGYGRRMARDLAGGLAALGWTVVSGMARGVDGTAHRAALEAGGATVGVLGSGLDHEYPASNRRLYAAMRGRGLLMSEFPPEEPPTPGRFPRRNRVIAALAKVVVVVQAGRRSGALITASEALALGREVMAVPGPVGPKASVGVHGLLRDGAAPATTPEDVLRSVGAPLDAASGDEGRGTAGPTAAGDSGHPEEDPHGRPAPTRAVRRALSEGPLPAEEVARRAGLSTGRVLDLLVAMELRGQVRGLPGARYELRRASRSPGTDDEA